MFETNLTQFGEVLPVIFDNTTLRIDGLYNQSQYINLSVTGGHIQVAGFIEGMDIVIELLTVQTIILFFILVVLTIRMYFTIFPKGE